MVDIDELARRACDGDMSALGELVCRMTPRLRTFLRRRGVGPELLDELVQEIWLKVAVGLRTFDTRRGFVPWLLVVSRNRLADHWRRQGSQQVLNGLSEAPAEAREPASMLADMDLVAQGLRELPAPQRSLIRLRYWEGLELKEIAARLDESYGAVKARVHRAELSLLAIIRRLAGNDTSE